MSLTKRVHGNFDIETIVGSNGVITLRSDTGITIDGNLTVLGGTTNVSTTDLAIVDNTIVLNSGESGAGVSATTAGIVIDRGTLPDTGIRYNESSDNWQFTNDGSTWYDFVSSATIGGFITSVVDDTTPQLGGNLDVNNFAITSAGSDIVLQAGGSGLFKVNQEISLLEQVTDETPTVGYNKVYAKVPGLGDSGIFYVASDGTTDELISKRKSVVYSLIF